MRNSIDWDAVLFGLAGLFVLLVIANSMHENKGVTGLAVLQAVGQPPNNSGNGNAPQLTASLYMHGTTLECRVVVTLSAPVSGLQLKFVAPDAQAFAILPIIQSDGSYIIRKNIDQRGAWVCRAHVWDARGYSADGEARLQVGDAELSPPSVPPATPESLPLRSSSDSLAAALSQAQEEVALSKEAGVDTRQVELQLQQARQLDARGEKAQALGTVAASRATLKHLYAKAKTSLSAKSWTIAGISLAVLLLVSAAFLYASKMRPPSQPPQNKDAPLRLQLASKARPPR